MNPTLPMSPSTASGGAIPGSKRAGFADQLLDAIARKGSPVCVGIDPVAGKLPSELIATAKGRVSGGESSAAEAELAAICEFVSVVLDAAADHVPAVKFQSACFERYRHAGVEAMWDLIGEAQRLGLIVILDAKRGDIGVSSEHYAQGFFEPAVFDTDVFGAASPAIPDAVTVSAYMGKDSVAPFLTGAGRGAFALVRTSNAGGDEVQRAVMADGATVGEHLARLVAQWGEAHVGEQGYSNLGAVVGATKAAEIETYRRLMPRTMFLVPGYGAQGATAADVKGFFNRDGRGALITASRSVIYAFAAKGQGAGTGGGERWGDAVAKAARQFAEEVRKVADEVSGR